MKQAMPILCGMLLCMSFVVTDNHAIIVQQFERLQGEWDGFMEYTEGDNKAKYSMQARCTTKYDGKKWSYEVQYDDGSGEIVGGGGDCFVNGDGTKMDYNGIVWDVVNITQSGDSAKIVMETKGKDNRKKATLRQTLEVTSNNFSITEEVRYENETEFFLRNRHLFRKKKG